MLFIRKKYYLNINKLFIIYFLSVIATTVIESNAFSATKNNSKFTVIIDAGHGGQDAGAIDNNAREKDINLGVAKKLAELIKKRKKDINVVMTRNDDSFISLQERANIANRNRGDLFISIHTNSVDKSNANRNKVSGTSVYALGPQKDANNLQVAYRENSVIELEDNYHQKYSGFDPSKDESYIIFEMSQKKTLAKSLKFANKAQKELVNTANRADRGVKQAGFWVLWATSMPSVLVELDFICNPDEAKFLTSNEGQEKLANALYNAIIDYMSNNDTKQTSVIDDKIPDSVNSTSQAVAENDTNEGEIGILTSSVHPHKSEKVHLKEKTPEKTNVQRKRRSAKSKEISNSRNIETSKIVLSDENAYLAQSEKKESKVSFDESKNPINLSAEDHTKSKTKSKKEKKDKKSDKDKSKNINKKTGIKTYRTNGNNTTFIVNSVNNRLLQNSENNNESNNSTSLKNNRGELVYKILLKTSDKELNTLDPEFYGLSPIDMYKENDLFKYTYGSSKSRKDIETKLLELKSFIPDATIVVRTE